MLSRLLCALGYCPHDKAMYYMADGTIQCDCARCGKSFVWGNAHTEAGAVNFLCFKDANAHPYRAARRGEG